MEFKLFNASGQVLGRFATQIAMELMGKNKDTYVPHLHSGNMVVVINAEKVRVTGNKATQMVYKRHSGRPGHLKEIPSKRMMATHPERILEHAIKGMLPKNKLGSVMMRRLRVYAGPTHPHTAQLPNEAQQQENQQ